MEACLSLRIPCLFFCTAETELHRSGRLQTLLSSQPALRPWLTPSLYPAPFFSVLNQFPEIIKVYRLRFWFRLCFRVIEILDSLFSCLTIYYYASCFRHTDTLYNTNLLPAPIASVTLAVRSICVMFVCVVAVDKVLSNIATLEALFIVQKR